ncbi:MAG: hypothetical protein WCP69_15035 [Bacteroidota bacterium]
MRIISIITILLICACTKAPEKAVEATLSQNESKTKTDVIPSDTSSDKQPTKEKSVNRKSLITQKAKNEIFTRTEEGPNDDNFNGQPMTQQLDLASNVLKIFPDTLIHLAKARYSNYDRFFPRSIADNFVDGISTEHISYPNLVFRFQLFENKFAKKPYLEKLITIKKNIDGTLRAE